MSKTRKAPRSRKGSKVLKFGATDAFEHEYMAKFEALAARYGIFVKYQRDRAARDIGLQLTKEIDGERRVTNTLCWFQMKGIMADTLPKERFQSETSVKVSLRVEHLRHWYLDRDPTHLVVYVQSADVFLVLNVQRHVARTWGRDILTLDQETATVEVPSSSVLDEQAFSIFLRQGDIEQWAKALDASVEDVKMIRRDFDVIWQIGSATERAIQCAARYREWISKMRHELCIVERPAAFDGDLDEGWEEIRDHWEFGGIELEESYPYLDFHDIEGFEPEVWVDDFDEEHYEFDEPDDGKVLAFRNGQLVFGRNFCDEYYFYIIGVRLNEYGQKLLSYIEQLLRMGLLEAPNVNQAAGWISIAPWHSREV